MSATADEDDDWGIRVDTLGFLANNLRGYEPTSILREQLQNADDATHKQQRRGELRLEFLADRLVVTNPSVFAAEDWRRLRRPNSRGKFLDAEQTGEFGVGFWGSLHLTDAPVVTSGELEVTLNPLSTTRRTVPLLDATRIEFPYRRSPTALSEALDAAVITADIESRMAATFVDQMAELLLFTRAIDVMTIELPNGGLRRATRTVESIRDGVQRLDVEIEGDATERCAYLTVGARIGDPPAGRHGRITVALPLTERHRGPGRAFFMFPTETDSGLHLSVDAHFRATDDRRSLENSGEHGVWNDRIFAAAGEAVGRSLEVILDPDVHGLDDEDAIAWFTHAGSQLPDIARRARLFTTALDGEARERAVVPDRSGRLRKGRELVDLPELIESILGDAIGDAARPTHRAETRSVYRRWGLGTWGARDAATWLRTHVPSERTPTKDAPAFVRDTKAALALLEFCAGEEQTLHGVALLLGTDDAYYPIGSSLARPSDDLQHLVGGLARPLVDRSFLGSWAARLAPRTTPQWLRDALVESTDRLAGKRVPLSSVGAASKQQHVSETIAAVRRTPHGLHGVPLALDEDSYLRIFDDTTVVGLPEADRKKAAQLARRLGFKPLHRAIDDDEVKSAGHRFDLRFVLDRIPAVDDWNPIDDSRLLVEVLATLGAEGATPLSDVERARELVIWQGSDGRQHPLSELRLPAWNSIVRSTCPLVAAELVGDPSPSSTVFATLNGLLRVDVLDTTEEVVLCCEDPPAQVRELRQLLLDLGDCDKLSRSQVQRLKEATFILCRDGVARRPTDVLLTAEELPLDLGDRCVDDEAERDRRVRERLQELGAPELPAGGELLDAASLIAQRDITADLTRDPGRVLWDHLVRCHDKYAKATLGDLATVPWLVAAPGPSRRKPRDCYDPNLAFAASMFPVPVGVATPAQTLREALRIRPTLETDDCVKLARHAAESGQRLDRQYFQYIDRRCRSGPSDSRKIGELRTLSIVHLGDGTITKPESLVSRQRAAIWGHLRSLVPDQFVEEFPNLVEAWGIATTADVDWHDHLDVLNELAQAEVLEARDRALATDRIDAIASLTLDEHQTETLRRRIHLLTSIGLRRCGETLRNDLPPSIVDRLAPHLPIVQESADTSDFLDRLAVRSLRSAVALYPLVEGVQDDEQWPEVLRRHSGNVLRFLKSSGTRLDAALLEMWPPIVKGVRSLAVRASLGGEVLDEWDAEAHLAEEGGGLFLYVVAGGQLTAQSVVDAIAFEFGIDRGRKSLLLGVLRAPSAAEGTQLLDWEAIPPLTERETAYLYEHESREVVFSESAMAQSTGAGTSPPADLDGVAPVDTEDLEVHGVDDTDFVVDPGDEPVRSDGALSTSSSATPPQEHDPAADTQWTDPDVLRSPRGTTDFGALEDQGIVIRRDLDEAPIDTDYEPASTDADEPPVNDEVRLCLSFFDVSHGVLPIESKALNRLTSNVALRAVQILGETVSARAAGPRHVQIENGTSIFHARQVVPGTVVRVHPSVPGTLEIEFRPHLHHVDGVWMLELDEDGNLERLRQDNIELQWETDDRFYRAARRLEDIEALMLDGGKSAVQLIIEAFLLRPEQGLTVEEIWDLVAINRLFADATIRQTLSSQPGLFEKRDGLWYKVGNELRVARGSGGRTSSSERSSPSPGGSTSTPASEAIKVARKLAQLLAVVDDATLNSVVQLLGIRGLLEDHAFTGACQDYMASPSPLLLDAIERELQADPSRGVLAATVLDECRTAALEQARPLLDLVCRLGSAAAGTRAQALLARLDSVAGNADGDPIEVAPQMVLAFQDGTVGQAEVWEWVERMWRRPRLLDPLASASTCLDELVRMERIHRSASRLSEPSPPAARARTNEIGWVSAQLPGEVYADADVQQLRAVVDLLCGQPSDEVVDGLHQLGLLAAQVPGAEGDAALHYALVGAHARHAGLKSPIVERSRKELERLKGSPPTDGVMRFVETWAELAHLPIRDVLDGLE